MFVDLKAVFDSMDREMLLCAMRQREIREELIKRIEEVMGKREAESG